MSDSVRPGILKSEPRLLSWEAALVLLQRFLTLPRFWEKWITTLAETWDHASSRFRDFLYPPHHFFECRPLTRLTGRKTYLRSLDSPLKPLMKWDNYSDQAAPIRRYWIFVVCLRWMMHVCICSPVLTALHASFLSFLFPCAVNRGFSKDFGRNSPAAMPSTPGGESKVVPIASLNPYQSKWVWLQFIPERSHF